MENILDLETRKSSKTSWRIGIITNLILGVIFLFLFSVESIDRVDKIDFMEVCTFTFGILFFINLIICPISLFLSKKYWLKWLIISALSFVLFFVLAVSHSYINLKKDLEKIENGG